MRVRYAPQYRDSPEALARVLVTAPNGTPVPLGQLADMRHVSGPAMIASENGLLVVSVLLNVRGRDVGSFVDEARQVVAKTVTLPPGSYIEWSGQYENEVRARQRLQIVIPVVLAIIYLLLYLTYHSLLEAAHVLLAVPFALSGGIYLLYALGYHVSVAVWVGFIALLWYGRPNRRGDGHLFGRSRRAQAPGIWRAADAGCPPGGRHGGSAPQVAAKSDDSLHRGGQSPADYVESLHRGRSDEAVGNTGPGRHGELTGARAPGDAGHLLLAQGPGAASRGRKGKGK